VSVLSREDLALALDEQDLDRRLVVTPLLDRTQIGRGAVDLRLGTEFLLLRRTQRPGLNPGTDRQQDVEDLQERVIVPFGETLWLHPRHFVLAATLEFLGLPSHLSAYVVGRSSWGRLGLMVATAVYIHPGFRGCLTLELVNEGDSPICLTPGSRIAQLAVHKLESPAEATPGETEKYHAPVRPQASRLSGEAQEFVRLSELGDKLRSRLG
jgi:dCTP deaminase